MLWLERQNWPAHTKTLVVCAPQHTYGVEPAVIPGDPEVMPRTKFRDNSKQLIQNEPSTFRLHIRLPTSAIDRLQPLLPCSLLSPGPPRHHLHRPQLSCDRLIAAPSDPAQKNEAARLSSTRVGLRTSVPRSPTSMESTLAGQNLDNPNARVRSTETPNKEGEGDRRQALEYAAV